MQRISVLAFTPRGSKPTMSKRLRSPVGKQAGSPASRDELDAGPSRPAGVDHERAERCLGLGRRQAQERDVEIARGGVAVVTRDADVGAQEAIAAVAPVGRRDLDRGGATVRTTARCPGDGGGRRDAAGAAGLG